MTYMNNSICVPVGFTVGDYGLESGPDPQILLEVTHFELF